MYAFDIDPNAPKAQLYDDLHSAAMALVDGEPDGVANMANVAALIWQFLPDLNWAGFYRMVEGELVLGPFVGKPACIRIALASGVCGTAAASGETQLVKDVHAFPGHIACDSASNSELVTVLHGENGEPIGVLDIDSPLYARFSPEDARMMERAAEIISQKIRRKS